MGKLRWPELTGVRWLHSLHVGSVLVLLGLLKVWERLRLIGRAALLVAGFAMLLVPVVPYIALIVVSACLVALVILDQAMTI